MPTITEFLEARIAEDEARARDFEHAHALTMNGDYGNYDAIYTAPSNWAELVRIEVRDARCAANLVPHRPPLVPRPGVSVRVRHQVLAPAFALRGFLQPFEQYGPDRHVPVLARFRVAVLAVTVNGGLDPHP